MKELPILFSTEMVQAILAGRKTMTRRVVDPQPIWNVDVDGNLYEGNHKGFVKVDGHPNWAKQFAHEFAKWKGGDLLWVRETYCPWSEPNNGYAYKADGFIQRYGAWERDTPNKFHDIERIEMWKPSIHMPKEAARIWLEVTDIRVERLQDITGQDVLKEGAGREVRQMWLFGLDQKGQDEVYRRSFQKLWESINDPQSWDANPWVWCVSYKVLSTTGKPEIKTSHSIPA